MTLLDARRDATFQGKPFKAARRKSDKPEQTRIPSPSTTPDSDRHALLLQAWECAFAGSPLVYLSGPITTGPRFVEWYLKHGRSLRKGTAEYAASMRAAVVEPNNLALIETARRLRLELREPVLEPASLSISDWSQADYSLLWDRVIERFAERIVVMPGWQFSAGCASELYRAFTDGLPVADLDGAEITLPRAIDMMRQAAAELELAGIPVVNVAEKADELDRLLVLRSPAPGRPRNSDTDRPKDESLDRLADTINVAQFVSFSPDRGRNGLSQRFSRVLGLSPNHAFPDHRTALAALVERSADRSINLRSYTPADPQSREFIYGLTSVDEAVAAAERLASDGLWVIANETVDIHDGGVSGVLMGDVVEFAPDATPRCVELPGIASLPREQGLAILATVYGFTPDLDVARTSRLEFSLHPKPRGWKHTRTLGWEHAAADPSGVAPNLSWPNHFSRLVGDKVFGLLVAHHCNLPVPRTTVVNRRVAPFTFGRPTGGAEVWLRTAPGEQDPGHFTTTKGWIDPYRLLAEEDPDGTHIPSILCQSGIPPRYSGAAIVTAHDVLVIEGRAGQGDGFMKGEVTPEDLPAAVRRDVNALYERARRLLGPVRFEWVHDGTTVWVVQLHRGMTQSSTTTIVPGAASQWFDFEVKRGLAELRHTLSNLAPDSGLILHGEVGLTSHVADVIRRAGVPAKLAATRTATAA